MKGITHCLCGIMVASCFAVAIETTVAEKSLILLLGAIFGILPDFLDFRIARYIETHHYEASPLSKDGLKLDPAVVANTMATAIEQSYATGKTVNVKLHAIKMGPDLWRQYSVFIDSANKRVVARVGPLVTTAQAPLPNTDLNLVAEAHFKPDIQYEYEKDTKIDIFSGPDFGFTKDGEKVRIDFIPWHRRWGHSLIVGLLFGPVGFLLYGFSLLGLVAFGIIVGAFWAHVIVDQIGMLGCNFFWPVTKKRTPGWLIIRHASDVTPNVFTNYIAAMIVLWNLNTFSNPAVQFAYFHMDWPALLGLQDPTLIYWVATLNYVFYTIIIPLGIVYAIVHWYKKKYLAPEKVTRAAGEIEEISFEEGEVIPR